MPKLPKNQKNTQTPKKSPRKFQKKLVRILLKMATPKDTACQKQGKETPNGTLGENAPQKTATTQFSSK